MDCWLFIVNIMYHRLTYLKDIGEVDKPISAGIDLYFKNSYTLLKQIRLTVFLHFI